MRKRLRTVAAVFGGLLVLLSLLLAYQAIKARSALLQAESQAQSLKEQISAGDVGAARTSLADLQKSTGEAESHTDGLLWGAAGKIPFLGKNLEAAQIVSRVLNDVSRDGLPPLVEIAGQVNADAFSPKGGRLDLPAIAKITPRMQLADAALASGATELRQLNATELLGPLEGPVARVQSELFDAHSSVEAGAKASELMPAMLGGEGSRDYLLGFQNNAEIRSTGGLYGAYAIVKADKGKLSMGRQGAATDFPYFDEPAVKLTKDENRLYSGLLAGYWGNTTLTPDFPRTAEIARAMLAKRLDEKVDGVISVDPIALSYILKGTGPVKLADGTSLTSDNAVKVLLNEVYLRFPNEPLVQDAFFADAAKRVFDVVASGRGESQALIQGLAKAVGENRILINSTHKAEQEVIGTTRVAGSLVGDDGSTPHVGLYLNDATETKLEYYLERETDVRATNCTRDGVQTLETTTVMRSNAPKNAASLPKSIVARAAGEKPGSFRMLLYFYAPYGGLLSEIRVNGAEQSINRFEHNGLNMVSIGVLLKPGAKVTVTTSMFTGRDQRDDAVFATTPGIDATPNNVRVPSACD